MIPEAGSDLASELWARSHRAVSSILCHPEGRAALATARRAQRLGAAGYREALADFAALHGELLRVGLDGALVRHAGELADKHALRGYDAVHLASALAAGPGTTFISWDRELRRAASQAAARPHRQTPSDRDLVFAAQGKPDASACPGPGDR